jgi:drug/metabolite transporter (DMT)-like permease
MASVLNATTPLFTALVATLWLRDRLTVFQIAGLLVGFFGVILLVWSKGSFSSGAGILAVAARWGRHSATAWA